ncbi:hypothetical protein [Halocatena marina]|uniref:hypothetical protein n=1 Tax=Halocatena marina TaxID=2934937 RepID=UPI0020107CFC|nr:hypothetical protein [Halocatena marina]
MIGLTRREVLRGGALASTAVLAGCNDSMNTASITDSSDAMSERRALDYIRPCSAQITEQFNPDDDAHIDIGPLTFANVLDYLPTIDVASGGKSVKARLIIDPGTGVTLTVPEAEREHVALDYNQTNWYTNGTPLDTAQQTVRFEACESDTPRQYNGGIVVTSSRCVTLEVGIDGETSPRKAVLPVGTKCES